MKRAIIILGIITIFMAGSNAATRYVMPPETVGITSGIPYNTWTNAATNIQWALDASSDGDIIWVTNGTYTLTNQIIITNSITLQSVNGTNFTFVNGNYPAYTNRCFVITNTAVLAGFTISNGFARGGPSEGGGGVFIKSFGTVSNCLIIWNFVSNDCPYSGGGGVYLTNGGTIVRCAILSNTVLYGTNATYSRLGGGAYIRSAGMITGCSLIGNVAEYSGGGASIFGGGTAINCVVSGNKALTYNGGGLRLQSAGSKALSCVIKQNVSSGSAINGGGVHIIGACVADSTIYSNITPYRGGGVYMEYGGIVSNCVISDNVATNGGGGINCEGDWGFYTVDRCIISRNVVVTSKGGGNLCQICRLDKELRNIWEYESE